MVRRWNMSWSLVALVLTAVFALPAGAHADSGEGPAPRALLEQVEAHEDQVAEHRKDAEPGVLTADIRAALELYAAAEGADDVRLVRKRLVKAVGQLTKRGNDPVVRKEALRALGDMGHKDGARYLKPFLKPVRGGALQPEVTPALRAAGGIDADSLVAPLLKMIDKSKNYVAASRAAAALGAFDHASRRSQEKILVELTKTLRKDLPSRPKRGHANQSTGDYIPGKQGSGGNARYSALSVAITGALNKLTGRHIQSYTEWMQMVNEHKRNLSVVFRSDA